MSYNSIVEMMGIPEKSFLNSELVGNAAEKILFII